jgi:carboxymethylenebutenolidase
VFRVKGIASAVLVLVSVLLSAPAANADVTQTTVAVGVRGNMQAQLFVPDGPGPFPGMLVLHTSGGLQEADLAAARQLAGAGYVCLVPAFMAAYGLTYDSRQDTFMRDGPAIYADLVSAIGTLRANPAVAGGSVGAIGFSNGGYFAVWLALTGTVQAAVSFYGAYTAAGADSSLTRFKQLANAGSAPILILHGLDDQTVPAGAARRLAGILGQAGVTHDLELYPDTGHSFDRGGFVPKGRGRFPATDTGDGAATIDAWTRALAFLGKYVR